MSWWRIAILSIAALSVARTTNADTAVASAREVRARIGDPDPAPAVQPRKATEAGSEEVPAAGAGQAVSEGAFLPFTVGASSDATYGRALSGYDGARRTLVYEAAADAHLVGGLAVRAGFTSHDLSGQPSALFGGRFQFLSQKRHGVDLGVGLFYLPQDIEGEGLVRASLLVGHKVGKVGLFGAASYGQDPEGDDHRAELALGSLVPLLPAIFVGVDARARALVFSSDVKHNGVSEPLLDIAVGPLAHYVLGPFVLTSQVGMSALVVEGPRGSSRPTNEMRYGALGLISAGLSL